MTNFEIQNHLIFSLPVSIYCIKKENYVSIMPSRNKGFEQRKLKESNAKEIFQIVSFQKKKLF